MHTNARRQQHQNGNAIIETVVALLALSPFLIGMPLLGKQLDVKHKSYDAARYAVWERTVWRSSGTSNRKSEEDISLEAHDRALGDSRSGIIPVASIRTEGVGENMLWRDRENRRLLDYRGTASPISIVYGQQNAPVEVGSWFVPGVVYGQGPIGTVAEVVRAADLDVDRRTFSTASMAMGLRPLLPQLAQRRPSLVQREAIQENEPQIVQRANGAILSDTWSAHDENTMRGRVDRLTTDELIEQLEEPGRIIGLQALGRGEPLYGEGQYGWDPDLRARSATLPAAYITRR